MGEALRSQARKLPDAPRDKPAQPGIQLHLPQPPSTAHRPRAETFLKQTWVYFSWLVAATCLPFTQFVSSIDTPYWSPHLLFLRVCLTPSYPGQPLMSASGITSAGKLTPRPSRRSSGRSGVSQHSAQKREGVAGSQSFSFHQTVNSWKILMTFISGPPVPHGHMTLSSMVFAHHLTSSFLNGSTPKLDLPTSQLVLTHLLSFPTQEHTKPWRSKSRVKCCGWGRETQE